MHLAPVPERPRRLVYLGTPAMAVPPLESLAASGFDIPLVITRADVRRGRGGAASGSPVKQAAELAQGAAISITFADGTVDAVAGAKSAEGAASVQSPPKRKTARPAAGPDTPKQGSLF